ncbi:MAG: hypothetical protein AB1635_01420 [Acidobacteriota bacterium]
MRRLLLAALVIALAGLAAWWAWTGRTRPGALETAARVEADPRPADLPSPASSPLGLRLTLVGGDGTNAHLAVVRVFNAAARQQALLPARPGATEPPAVAPTTVDLTPVALAGALTVARVDGLEEVTLSADAVRIAHAPASPSVLDGATTVALRVEIDAAAVPAGSTLRARLRVPGHDVRSNRATLEPTGDDPVARLTARGHAQHARADWPGLLETGDALVAAEAGSPTGHWFRGLSLEATGDRDGARAAYEAAAARVTPGLEPPIGLYSRLAALAR